jgi:hypothetical protein
MMMETKDLANLAWECKKRGINVSLEKIKGTKSPKGFPRGELLCENSSGGQVYSYDPIKILKWMAKMGIIVLGFDASLAAPKQPKE